ncbi:MAG: DUF1189 family protein [Alphaproteobacteria bacterium]|nr:DUF1189 family protein [Alphaproteobacteria bacterium]
MQTCPLKSCSLSLLFRSFYDKYLAESYISEGHGIGFAPLFVLAVLSSVVYAVYSVLLLNAFSPELITEKIIDLPTIEVRDGQIVQPENFFQRFSLGNGVHVTLDTTSDAEIIKNPSPNEIYISKNGVHFVKGQKLELMPLKKLLGTDNMTITAQNITDFVTQISGRMKVALPSFVFLISVPILFLKYGILTYLTALLSYVMTLFFRKPMHFEARMRLAAVSVLPVFVFNFFFGTLFGLFDLGMIAGVIITLVYLYFYIGQLPEEQEKTAE